VNPRRTVVDIVRTEENSQARDPSPGQDSRIELSSEAFEARRAQAPRTIGEIGDIREDTDSFAIEVLLTSSPREFRLAVFSVPKASWDAWWAAHAREFDPSALRSDSGSPEALPRPAPNPAMASITRSVLSPAGGQAAGTTPCLPDDSWTPYLPGGRINHSAIWTGSVMVVWGGINGQGPLGTGGRFDPATDTWTPTSLVGAPSARFQHVGVWTGSRMLIWGGRDGTQWLNGGGRYDPVTDTWAPISLKDAPPPRLYLGDWSGSRLLVWGSFESTPNFGGRYDPVADVWTPISTAGSPSPRNSYSVVWAANVLIVWGGVDGTGYVNTGGRYDPVSDTWTPTSLSGAPRPATAPRPYGPVPR